MFSIISSRAGGKAGCIPSPTVNKGPGILLQRGKASLWIFSIYGIRHLLETSGRSASHCPWSGAIGCQHLGEEILQSCPFGEKPEWIFQSGQMVHCMQNWSKVKGLDLRKKEGQFSGPYILSTYTSQLLAAILSAQTRNDLFSLPYRRKEQNLLSMQEASCPVDSYQQLCSTHSEHVTWVHEFVYDICITTEIFRKKKSYCSNNRLQLHQGLHLWSEGECSI